MRRYLQRTRDLVIAAPLVGRLAARVGALERWTLAAIVTAAAALFAFGKLAEAVAEGGARGFDTRILLALRNPDDPSDPLGPRWFEELMRDFTALGGVAVLVAVTLFVCGFLLILRRRHTALMVAAAVGGGTLLSQLLKWSFDRPRPDLVPHGSEVYTQSFPSGHSMMAAVVYLTLGALLARTQARQAAKVYLLGGAALLTVLVGISRVYLGVHWPTDVLAGWAMGAAWALICWLVMLWLQRRGQVEPENANGE